MTGAEGSSGAGPVMAPFDGSTVLITLPKR
jgi:hypothetical protein